MATNTNCLRDRARFGFNDLAETAAVEKPLVLLVDDDLSTRRYLRRILSSAGYGVAEANSGEQALSFAGTLSPVLVILDPELPGADKQDLLRKLREWLVAPIIVLSAHDETVEKIAALDQGADDYLTKPFGAEELLARMRVALRHAANGKRYSELPVLAVGDLQVNIFARRVFVRHAEVRLTPTEYKLLTTLVRHAGKVITHRYLFSEVWGPTKNYEPHRLRVFVSALRRKIETNPSEPRHLQTEPGVGYRLAIE
jgi:two-component system, OmpR family, KDP operon response regulator KdpE